MHRTCLILILLFMGCQADAGLPKERPADFRVDVLHDGGLMAISRWYSIRSDSTIYEIQEEGLRRRVAFPTPSKQLDSLYQRLRRLRVPQISTTQGEFDPWGLGGYKLEVQAANRITTSSSSGGNIIDPRWKDEFNEAVFAVVDFVKSRLAPLSSDFQVSILYGDSLMDLAELRFALGLDFQESWRRIEARGRPEYFSISELPGPHRLTGYVKLGEESKEFSHLIELRDSATPVHFKVTRQGLLRILP